MGEQDQTQNREVFRTLRWMIEYFLRFSDKSIILDACNVCPAARRPFISIARAFQVPISCTFMAVPLEECLRRNAERTRKVPEDVIKRFAKRLVPPTHDEGFHIIDIVS